MNKTILIVSIIALFALQISGCKQNTKVQKQNEPPVQQQIDPDTLIGQVSDIVLFDTVAVEGYGLVVGLNGTGSAQCTTDVREYLLRYLGKELPRSTNAENLINSINTAVVKLRAQMPTDTKGKRFDIQVGSLDGTDTTSLENGLIISAELKESGKFGFSTKTLAKVEGPIFIDGISKDTDPRNGYILNGGAVLDDYKSSLLLKKPDFKLAAAISNRINERFGGKTANALSAELVELNIPPLFSKQKKRFLALLKATYLIEIEDRAEARINSQIQQLINSGNKNDSEIRLEAMGKRCIKPVAALLQSDNEEIRFRAARILLNLGYNKAIGTLRETALNDNSAFRTEAIEAVCVSGPKNEASALCRTLLQNKNLNIVLAAYEKLRAMQDISITQNAVYRKFYLEQITNTSQKAIFVSRSGEPRVALFGTPLTCKNDIFIETDDQNITINASAAAKNVTIFRKNPNKPDSTPIRAQCSFDVADIIQTLCSEIYTPDGVYYSGLGVSYDQAIKILSLMCEKDAIKAAFVAGDIPKI